MRSSLPSAAASHISLKFLWNTDLKCISGGKFVIPALLSCSFPRQTFPLVHCVTEIVQDVFVSVCGSGTADSPLISP